MSTNSLKRTLTLPALIFYGTGMILGAGIYSIIGKAAGIVGNSLWATFLLAAVCASLTALSYCELAALEPKAGAEYTYMQIAFPNFPWLATAIGIIMALAGASTAAAVALAFGGYLNDFISMDPLWSGIALLVILTMINIAGIQESSRINMIFTLIEIGGLILFIILGFSPERFTVVLTQPISPKIITGTALIIFAYFGFEDIVNLSEEAKNPEKIIPKAILWSLGISTILYILVSLAAVSIAPLDKLISSNAPLMDSAKSVSPKMAVVLGVCALFSTANTVLIAMLAASRAIFAMSADRSFPSSFAKVLPKNQTPWLASLLVLGLAIVLIPFGGVETIASISSLATLMGFFTVNIVLIRLRYKNPDQPRPFMVPIKIGKLPLLPSLAALTTVVLLFQFESTVYRIGLSGMALVLLSQVVFLKMKPRAP